MGVVNSFLSVNNSGKRVELNSKRNIPPKTSVVCSLKSDFVGFIVELEVEVIDAIS